VDRELEADLLGQTLEFCRPESILLCGIREDDQRFLPLIQKRTRNYVCVHSLNCLPTDLDLSAFDLVLFCGVDYLVSKEQMGQFRCETVFCFAGLHDMALYQYLYNFAYVRILDHGFGLFSHSPTITTWIYKPNKQVSNIHRSLS